MRRAVFLACAVLLGATPALARDGHSGPDRLSGSDRADTIHGNGGPDVIYGRGGPDLLTGDTGPDRVDGGRGDDVITGASGRDALKGTLGDDVISGGFGADALAGGDGNDVLSGDNDDDVITGGNGNDVIHGGSGTDVIDGGAGDDLLFNDSGADQIKGGPGDDEIVVDPLGRRGVNCGPGDDTIVVLLGDEPSSSRSYTAGFGCEHRYVTRAVLDPNRGITRLAGNGGDTLVGTSRDDTLLGGPGPDVIRGGAGNDVLWGLRQADTVSGASDVLDGGAGDDTFYGGPGPQTIRGGRGADFLEGGLGRNTIAGGDGNDVVRLRGTGPDSVTLGAGDDVLHGIASSRGTVSCGPGRDRVEVSAATTVRKDCERVRRLGGRRAARAAEPTQYADAIRATDGLVRYWRLDEAATMSSAADAVGGHVATVTGKLGSPGVTDDGHTAWNSSQEQGRPTDNGAIIPQAPLTGVGDTITVEAWVRTAADYGNSQLLSAGGEDDPLRLRVGVSTYGVHAYFGSGSTGRQADVSNVGLGWHHVAVTAGPDGLLRLVVDGVVGNTYDNAYGDPRPVASPNWTRLRIGNDARWQFQDTTDFYATSFSGQVDEVAVYAGDPGLEALQAHRDVGRTDAPPTVTVTYKPEPQSGLGTVAVAFDAGPSAGTTAACIADNSSSATPCSIIFFAFFWTFGPHEITVTPLDRFGRTGTPVVVRFEMVPTGIAAVSISGGSFGDPAAVAFAGVPGRPVECTIRHLGDPTFTPWAPCTSPLTVATGDNVGLRQRDGTVTKEPAPMTIVTDVDYASGATIDGQPGAIRYQGFAGSRCALDAGPLQTCFNSFGTLRQGRHVLDVHGTIATPTGEGQNTAAAQRRVILPFTVGVAPTSDIIVAPQYATVLEAGTLQRRSPRLRMRGTGEGSVTAQIRDARNRPLGSFTIPLAVGANLVKVPTRLLTRLDHGRYVMRLRATSGARTTARNLPFAVIPRRR